MWHFIKGINKYVSITFHSGGLFFISIVIIISFTMVNYISIPHECHICTILHKYKKRMWNG